MTENDRYEIVVLSEELEKANLRCNMLAMRDSSQLPANERTTAYAEYQLACTHLMELEWQMTRLKMRIVQSNTP